MIRFLLALVLVTTGLAGLTTGLATGGGTGPAEAAKSSTIRGWRTAPLTVTRHARRTLKLRVATAGGPVKRKVRIQVRRAGQTVWRPGPRQATNQRGKVRYRWQAPLNEGSYQIRAVALRRGAAARVVSAERAVTVRDPWAGEVRALVTRLNRARATARQCGSTRFAAVPPLVVDERLATAARRHAQAMADRGFFSHISPGGRTPQDRARAAGYRGLVGENIAAGPATAAAVIDMWLRSPGHCRNLMGPDYRSVGIGHGYQPGSPYRHYWVLDNGTR